MLEKIATLVQEFKQSIIQSEAEVRSKFIVPLLEILEYPSSIRAEEFPVYGFEGGKHLPAKNADFLLFSSKEFAAHRKCTQLNLEWVQKNSLLVVEAKKPGEMPDILGQPQYYTVWTKSVAYLAIDGLRIRGYYYSSIYSDREIIDCSLDELTSNSAILAFAYANILRIKEDAGNFSQQLVSEANQNTDLVVEDLRPVTEDEIEALPETTFRYMRQALGRNSEGLSNYQVLARFLNLTNTYLQNDMRYDIPVYMFAFPRKFLPAQLSINNDIFPTETGEVTVFYLDDFERYLYKSKNITIDIAYFKGNVDVLHMGFQVRSKSVSSRIGIFEKMRKIFSANIWKVSFSNPDPMVLTLDPRKNRNLREIKKEILSRYDECRKDLEQLQLIEDFYETAFELHNIPAEKVGELRSAIFHIHTGITLQRNCEINCPCDLLDESFELSSHLAFEDVVSQPMESFTLFGKTFVPDKSWILPFSVRTANKSDDGFVSIPGCIRYKILE